VGERPFLLEMWFFPTRKRPVWLQRLIDACVMTNMTSPGMVVIDGKRTDYPNLTLPPNVNVAATGEHLEFAGVLRWIFATFPREPFYGFICDDGIPRTPNWDVELERTAGRWYVSCSNDLLHGAGRWSFGALGGDLLRALGFWIPPGFIHLYVDNVWEHLDRELHIMRYRPDIVIEEMHFSNGKAPRDLTYERIYRGQAYGAIDQALFEAWVTSPKTVEAIDRVRALLEAQDA